MAQAFAGSLLAARGERASVRSAGLVGWGRPATDEAVEVMAGRNLDLSSHRSGSVAEALEQTPDLVVAMAREHARAVVELRPELFPRTFTLKEIVRRVEEVGARLPDEDLPAYLTRIGEGREVWHLAGFSSSDDVADPVGQDRTAYERCAEEIERLVSEMVEHFWPGR